ncbi:MAG: hypothetical protein ACPGD8_02035 [Flavobacteriales bacterium]
MSTKIVYLAHTQQRILDDAVFSILNLVHQGVEKLDCEILVGTDKPECFDGLPVTIWPVSEEQIEGWKGEIDFIHRTKPCFLALVAEANPEHNILYFDADTAVKSSLPKMLTQIGGGQAIMHASEGTLAEAEMPVYKKLRVGIKSGELNLDGLPQTEMFNAGVIGIPAKHTGIFREVVASVDVFYPKLKVHIVEQVLFSYLIGKKASVIDSSNQVVHWWGKGLNTGPVISEFLRSSGELNLEAKSAAAVRLVQTIEQTPFNRNPTFLERLKRSVKKRIK